jgi:hypothetical protein
MISWRTDLASNDGVTTRTMGEAPSMAMPVTSRWASKLTDLKRTGATATMVCEATINVVPSGGDLASRSAAIRPLAPVRLSISTVPSGPPESC